MDAAAAAALDYKGARYTRVAVWLHWAIAALILFNLVLGFIHDVAFDDAGRRIVMPIHKSIGFIVLALTLVRIGWRLGHPAPAPDSVLKTWEAALARTIHFSFYALLLLIPMSGWLLASASRMPVTNFLWLFSIPPLPAHGPGRDFWENIHWILGLLMSLLVLLHVLGAMKHHMDGHKQIFRRMAPWITDPADPVSSETVRN
jgi:cytochrome b561